ncbi:SDR family oxidoreductase [Lichenibacterium minor]|uniref:SDR family oxidoreductase n=1 Tax=Lichenibacterium minor TaxID=2316528 RepID=A0A4Q2U493_9HYPH|nr:SDR family NAD(P)-dependent oxidoreductase [Lichenibacterium minor]RYC29727.1 SDR family oxidoreductase [Lichenibacterium minor]
MSAAGSAPRRFEGRGVLVTGAASGIGRAAALLFAAEGARVMALDRDAGVAATADAILARGGDAEAVVADAASEPDVRGAVEAAEAKFGALDAVFANAGISGGMAGLFDQTAEDFAAVLRVNLLGPFLALKHAGPRMAARGRGAVVCTASVAGLRAGAGGPAYSASKAGVVSLVQVAAQQLAGTGVRVNAVCPGLVETGMTRFVFDGARERGKEHKLGSLSALRRPGLPDEIARAVLFLASDEASYVTGQALAVDGGLSAQHPFGRPREPGQTTM